MSISLLIGISIGLLVVAIFIFRSKYMLYKKGVINEAEVIDIETFSYVTPAPEYGLIYHTGYTPIIQIMDDGKKTIIKFYSETNLKPLSVGDKFKVIYPKGKIEKAQEYTKYGLYKLPIGIMILSVLLFLISLIIVFFL